MNKTSQIKKTNTHEKLLKPLQVCVLRRDISISNKICTSVPLRNASISLTRLILKILNNDKMADKGRICPHPVGYTRKQYSIHEFPVKQFPVCQRSDKSLEQGML
jgi:hypothetical protein